MKRICSIIMCSALLTVSMAGCDEEETPVVIPEVVFDQTWLTLGIDEDETLTASLTPSEGVPELIWKSSNPSVATVSEGVIRGVSEGEAVISVSVAGREDLASCTVIVSWLGKIGFVSDRTWEIGSQVWSDAVVTSRGKNKLDFDGGTEGDPNYKVDVRENSGYGDWFSWAAVDKYKTIICPEGWRIPTMEDFVTLDIALGGDGNNHNVMDGSGYYPNCYIDDWGGQYGGYCWWYQGNLELTEVGTYGAYWSSTSVSDTQAYGLCFGSTYGYRLPVGKNNKYSGFMVRLVKDAE